MQFGKFELKPPSTTKDVVCVIEALKEKQVSVTNLVNDKKLQCVKLSLKKNL